MGIELPRPSSVFLPNVPDELRTQSPELYDWAQRTKRNLEGAVNDMFANISTIATAINSGTSGTFIISSGGSIIVTSGIVITVTS